MYVCIQMTAASETARHVNFGGIQTEANFVKWHKEQQRQLIESNVREKTPALFPVQYGLK